MQGTKFQVDVSCCDLGEPAKRKRYALSQTEILPHSAVDAIFGPALTRIKIPDRAVMKMPPGEQVRGGTLKTLSELVRALENNAAISSKKVVEKMRMPIHRDAVGK
jgi:hypothetical protein